MPTDQRNELAEAYAQRSELMRLEQFQEKELLAAFRMMPREAKRTLLRVAQSYAMDERGKRPALRLVV